MSFAGSCVPLSVMSLCYNRTHLHDSCHSCALLRVYICAVPPPVCECSMYMCMYIVYECASCFLNWFNDIHQLQLCPKVCGQLQSLVGSVQPTLSWNSYLSFPPLHHL